MCEAPTTLEGWRLPEPCLPERLGQRVLTCWMPEQDWPRLVEFFASRYPHARLDGQLLRIAGQVPTPRANPALTPPLLIAQQRTRGVELLLLAGDPVDMPGPATETATANPASPRSVP